MIWLYWKWMPLEDHCPYDSEILQLELDLSSYTSDHGWGIFCDLDIYGKLCKTDTVLYVLLNARHFWLGVQGNYLFYLGIVINPSLPTVGFSKCRACVFLPRAVSLTAHNETAMVPILANRKNFMFSLTSTMIHPKMLILYHPIQL